MQLEVDNGHARGVVHPAIRRQQLLIEHLLRLLESCFLYRDGLGVQVAL